MTLEEAASLTILRATVGSTIHGLALEGNADRDEMGLLIEPFEVAMGLAAPFEQFIQRDAAIRESKHDAPSQPGDLDLTIYGLRKYIRLALGGNPTVISLLFIPTEQLLSCNAHGSRLRELRGSIVSRQAGRAFLGYLQAQRQRLVGERGQKRTTRLDLEEKYGFDVKYAMHMLRLGFQGVELLSTGQLSFPMQEPARNWLVGVRTGSADLQECLTRAGQLEAELKDLLQSSPLPEHPNSGVVEAWMLETYMSMWGLVGKAEQLRWQREVMGVEDMLAEPKGKS